MSQIKALDLKVGDIHEGEQSYALGLTKVARITHTEDETLILWSYDHKMNFAMNEANYSASRNPSFNIINR